MAQGGIAEEYGGSAFRGTVKGIRYLEGKGDHNWSEITLSLYMGSEWHDYEDGSLIVN